MANTTDDIAGCCARSKFLNKKINNADMHNEEQEFQGRVRIIQSLMSKRKFSLSIGSKKTRFAEINLDIDPSAEPDIVADAKCLPFANNVFEQVLFTDVIEHLPKVDEPKALQEIYRVLCNGGELILTTAYDTALYTFLDPARYVVTHRHYKRESIKHLLESHGFNIEMIFNAGGLWCFLSNLWYCFITYPVKKILHSLPYSPLFMQRRWDQEYKAARQNGYKIFAKAKKK